MTRRRRRVSEAYRRFVEFLPMSALRFATAFAAVCLAATPTHAVSDPQGYTCVFNVGAARTYDKGRFKPEKASKVAFEIDKIAPEQQSAQVKRGEAIGTLRVVRAVNALHFLEVVGEGFMNVTTVYDRDAKATKHPAVHSRHFGVLGQPIFAQYQGLCTAR